jgi:hypothetical protein
LAAWVKAHPLKASEVEHLKASQSNRDSASRVPFSGAPQGPWRPGGAVEQLTILRRTKDLAWKRFRATWKPARVKKKRRNKNLELRF